MEVNDHQTPCRQSDIELVDAALRHNNRLAFAELMRRYHGALYQKLLTMTGDADDADDLTLEAFTKAFKNLEQYTGEFAFSTWLHRIAVNHGIDFLRRRKVVLQSLNPVEGYASGDQLRMAEIPSETPDPEERIIIKQRLQLLSSVIDKLNPRYSKLIRMRYFQELSYEEISEKLDMPLGTVKTRLFRARELLYSFFTEAS